MEVTFTPGVTTGELLDVFLEENVCFSSDVIAQNFTYGGVLSTGSHVGFYFCTTYLYSIHIEWASHTVL